MIMVSSLLIFGAFAHSPSPHLPTKSLETKGQGSRVETVLISSPYLTHLVNISSPNKTMISSLLLLFATISNQSFIDGFSASCSSSAKIKRFYASSRFSRAPILYTASLTDDKQQHVKQTELHSNEEQGHRVNIVLVTGFESFNRDMYKEAGMLLPKEFGVNLKGEFPSLEGSFVPDST